MKVCILLLKLETSYQRKVGFFGKQQQDISKLYYITISNHLRARLTFGMFKILNDLVDQKITQFTKQNKMTRNINHPSKHKMLEQQIKPWNAQDSHQLNLIQSTMLHYYQPVNRQNLSFNPQTMINQTKSKKPLSKDHNFCDNLRKYQKKKAEQILNKKDTNFIQKNKQKIVEDFVLQPQENKNSNMIMSNLFVNDKTFRNVEQYLPSGVEPINWSLIMYYQTQKSRRKPRHKDIQSFLRFQSQRKERENKRESTRQNSQINQQNLSKFEDDKFQKMLKLKEGIRRRNLRSASSSSRQNFEDLQNSVDQLRQSQNTPHRAHGMIEFQKKVTPKTSFSARIPRKNEAVTCRIQIIGSKNIISASKQPRSDLRMIHSSQRNRPINKLLNIHGNKVESSKKFNNNV